MSQNEKRRRAHRHLSTHMHDGDSPSQKWMQRFRELSWTLAMAESAADTLRAMKALDRHALTRVASRPMVMANVARGWKTVPLEPTPKMLDAALLAEWAADPKDSDKYHAAVYRAMLARAPIEARTAGLEKHR